MALSKIMTCPVCGEEKETVLLKKQKYICSRCRHHFRIPAQQRIAMIVDKGSFVEWEAELDTVNCLNDEGYEEKLQQARQSTGLREAVIVGKAHVLGVEVALAVCDSFFIMGSMGHVVGEKITAMVERATELRLPVFIFCCSGGARMQEGMVSLMQMEKTAAALKKHAEERLFYCAILTDPTTGGVTASFASLGDVIMAEPGATVGFAGRRVIQQTIGEELPEGFQSSEFLLEHGMIDGIVQRNRIRQMIQFLARTNRVGDGYANFLSEPQVKYLPFLTNHIQDIVAPAKSAWERVKENRGTKRPSAMDYINNIFDVFVEMKGDRLYGEDGAIVGGIAMLDGQPVTVIANYRGRDARESIQRHFGMPMPEGYRKALRLMKQAEKFNRPVITFVNTLGAYCGVDAEARGQGWAIAQNLYELSLLRVPILVIIIGEGGSGGALATAVGNEVWMLENATYGVLSPEGYASILWKDASKAPSAAARMKMTAQELKELGIIDRIIPEYGGASKSNVSEIAMTLKGEITQFLSNMSALDAADIVNQRYNRFRRF